MGAKKHRSCCPLDDYCKKQIKHQRYGWETLYSLVESQSPTQCFKISLHSLNPTARPTSHAYSSSFTEPNGKKRKRISAVKTRANKNSKPFIWHCAVNENLNCTKNLVAGGLGTSTT